MTDTVVAVTGTDSAPSSGGPVSLRIRNQTGVPITVGGRSTMVAWTVRLETTVDLPLFGPKFDEVISFKPDLQAGVTRRTWPRPSGPGPAAATAAT